MEVQLRTFKLLANLNSDHVQLKKILRLYRSLDYVSIRSWSQQVEVAFNKSKFC